MTQWIGKWKKNHWKTSTGKLVKNRELWQELEQEVERHDVHWHWVRGHNGHPENERADELARLAIDLLLASKHSPALLLPICIQRKKTQIRNKDSLKE